MKRPVIVALVALGAVGCTHKTYWSKPGATQRDYETDLFNCEKARHETPSDVDAFRRPSVLRESHYIDNCLIARGWTPRKVTE